MGTWKVKIVKKVFGDEDLHLLRYLAGKRSYRCVSKRIFKEMGFSGCPIPHNYERQIRDFWWETLGIEVKTIGYEYYYSVIGVQDVNYIPADVFAYYIDKRLNNSSFAPSYADKNMYDLLFPKVATPPTVIRNINGRFFDGAYNFLEYDEALDKVAEEVLRDKIIVKPSVDSGGGKNISLIDLSEGNLSKSELKIETAEIFNDYGQNYIIQNFVQQHELLDSIYPHSLNTMRIITFEMKGEIDVLACVLKLGNNSGFLDKVSKGGLACGISRNGSLKEHAFSKSAWNPVRTHPQTGFRFKDTVVPNFHQVRNQAKALHKRLAPHFRLVGWDFSIDKDGCPMLIEINLRTAGITIPQLCCGPLFGDKTADVLRGLRDQ